MSTRGARTRTKVAESPLSERSTPPRNDDVLNSAPLSYGAGSVVWAKFEGSLWPAKVVPLSSASVPVKFFEINKSTMVPRVDVRKFCDPSTTPPDSLAFLHVPSGAFNRAVAQALKEQAAAEQGLSTTGPGVGVKRSLDMKPDKEAAQPSAVQPANGRGSKVAAVVQQERAVRESPAVRRRTGKDEIKLERGAGARTQDVAKDKMEEKSSKKRRVGKQPADSAKEEEKMVTEEASPSQTSPSSEAEDSQATTQAGTPKCEQDAMVEEDALEEEEEETAYEQKRRENMRRNQEILAALALPSLPAAPAAPSRSSSVRARGLQPQQRAESVPTRQRSLRIQGMGSDGKKLPDSWKEPLSTRAAERSEREAERERREGELGLAEMSAVRRREQREGEDAESFAEREREAAEEEAKLAALAGRVAKVRVEQLAAGGGGGAGVCGGDGATVAEYVEGVRGLRVQESDVAKVVRERVTALTVHPSRDQLMVIAGDKTGRIGFFLPDSASDDSCVSLLDVHARAVVSLAVDPLRPARLFSASYDNHVRALDLEARACGVLLDAEEGGPRHGFMSALAWDPHRQVLYGGHAKGEVSLMDPREGGRRAQFKALHDKTVRTVDVHPGDSNRILTGSIDTFARLWDVRKLKAGEALAEVEHGRGVTSARFNGAGTLAVTTSYDNTLRVLDVAAAKETVAMEHNNDTGRWLSAFQAVFDPRRSEAVFIGSMANPRGVDVLNARTGKRMLRLEDDNFGYVTSLNEWHPHLPILAGANSSGKVLIWR